MKSVQCDTESEWGCIVHTVKCHTLIHTSYCTCRCTQVQRGNSVHCVLYEQLKSVPRLPTVLMSDPRRIYIYIQYGRTYYLLIEYVQSTMYGLNVELNYSTVDLANTSNATLSPKRNRNHRVGVGFPEGPELLPF